MSVVHPPSTDDGVVAGASNLIGGPLGSRSTGRLWSWGTALRLCLIVCALTCGAAYARTSVCAVHTPAYSSDFQYTRLCYSDVYVLYYAEGLGSGPGGTTLQVPYADHPVEYPPVMGYLMLGAAEITHAIYPHEPSIAAGANDPRPQVFFDITALLLACCALLLTWAVARLAGAQRVWDAAMVALSPVLLMHAFTNWDLVAVALTVGGLLAWSRRRPVLAGALLGLGIATKLFPVLVLLAIGMCCLRARRLREWGLAIAGAAGAVVVAYLPAILMSGQFRVADGCPQAHQIAGWQFFSYLSQTRGADSGSIWLVLQNVIQRFSPTSHPLDSGLSCGTPAALNVAAAVAIAACATSVLLLVMWAPRRPRIPQVAFLLLAAFIVFNKVDSPQYALWLLPFAVLARPRWGAILAWQASEVILGAANLYELIGVGKPGFGLPLWTYLLMIVVRDIVIGWLAALIIRAMLHPELDPVRQLGVDDPTGGVLDGAPDGWAPARAAVPESVAAAGPA
jgi:uncharacterized membrane protein